MRDVPEWIGRSDNTAVPPRVRLRVFERDGGICQCGCGRKISVGDKWQTDHMIALINGGENRESNLRSLLDKCHAVKTGADVGEKAVVARVRKKHVGIRKPSRFPAARNSIWKKKMDGSVVRR